MEQPDAPAKPAAHPPTESFDPYAPDPAAVKDPPRTLGKALLQIGPGLILAGSIVGTGELIATTHAGAKAGMSILWLVIVSCFIKVFVQIELGRYAVSSGETTLESFARLPGPGVLLTWWWLFMTACTQFQLATMVGGVGQTGHMVFPSVSAAVVDVLGGPQTALGGFVAARPVMPWALFTAAVTSILLVIGSYRVVEKGTTVMVVTFTAVTVTCVALLPAAGHPIALSDLGTGMSFRIPTETAVILAAITMFGITGVGASELIMYPYWCIEKGYARNVGPRPQAPPPQAFAATSMDAGSAAGRPSTAEEQAWVDRARGWMRVMKLDAWVSMVVYTIATLAFFLLGAVVLYKHTEGGGLPGSVDGMMETLRQMYVPVLGQTAATWFIVVGTFAVLYSTLFAATAANCRTVTDFLRVNDFIVLRSHADRMWWVRLLCIGFPILNLVLFLWVGNPVAMVMIGGVAQALTLPMIATAAVYLRFKRTDPRITSRATWDVFLILSMLALYGVAAYGVWTNVAPLFLGK
jgi:Mn2+/Fe2+ NRAMP family transporter